MDIRKNSTDIQGNGMDIRRNLSVSWISVTCTCSTDIHIGSMDIHIGSMDIHAGLMDILRNLCSSMDTHYNPTDIHGNPMDILRNLWISIKFL